MIADTKTATEYARLVMDIRAMLLNISEFVDTMPAPEDGDDGLEIHGVDYAWIGSVNEVHKQLTVASEIVDQLSE